MTICLPLSLGVDPLQKALAIGGVGAQTRQSLENMKNIVEGWRP